MKIDNSNIYTQNLAELNSAKYIKENNESFDSLLENEMQSKPSKADSIKDSSDLYTYIGDRLQEKLGQTFANKEAAKKIFLITAASFASKMILINEQNPNSSQENPGYFLQRPDLWQEMGTYGNTDEIKQELVNTISLLQSDVGLAWLPSKENYEEFKARKQEGADFLKEIYKELFNEEPVVPKFETLDESSIDISAAIKEFLSKPYEKEEDVFKFMEDLDEQNQKEPSIEILGIKEKFYKQNETLKSENLKLLLQNI